MIKWFYTAVNTILLVEIIKDKYQKIKWDDTAFIKDEPFLFMFRSVGQKRIHYCDQLALIYRAWSTMWLLNFN